MRVLGTAGHVDHGKSTLVLALTGINPDRLREEQERQMTIDLGFAWMQLPGGEEIGLVDVPGHRDFIENMLAGVGGIDAALLVVAADEGVMPQTREHVAILDLLGVSRGLVALTKIDLVDDSDWIELVREEIAELLRPTALAGAAVLPVSSATGAGLEALRQALAETLRTVPPRVDLGRPRLPVDRVFTMAGFGTVVTGTLADGVLHAGEEVEILPSGRRARIRGLQTHKTRLEQAVPGSRTAVNLSGVEVREIERGDVLTRPGSYEPTRRLDVRARLLPEGPAPLRHDDRVKVFLGTAQRVARVRVLGADSLAPGEQGWLQLVLDRPVAAARRDPLILRRPSPGATLGGAVIAEAHPIRLHRRKDPVVPERLARALHGEPADQLAAALAQAGPGTLRAAIERARLEPQAAEQAAQVLRAQGRLVEIAADGELVADRAQWQELLGRLRRVLQDYHDAQPMRTGMPREELKSRLPLDARVLGALVEQAAREGWLTADGPRLALAEHRVALNARQQAQVDELLRRFAAAPASPPSVKECAEAVGEALLNYLVESGALVQLSAEVVLEQGAYRAWVQAVQERLAGGRTLSVAEVRDLFGTSRKYVLALLEHLDALGVTVRQGDVRRLGGARPGAD